MSKIVNIELKIQMYIYQFCTYWTKHPTAVSLILMISQNSSSYGVFVWGSSSNASKTHCRPPLVRTNFLSSLVSEKFHSKLKQCIWRTICSLLKCFSLSCNNFCWLVKMKEIITYGLLFLVTLQLLFLYIKFALNNILIKITYTQ